ncbi:MAG: response regulator [Candidatus Aminicenantes bacterium]|nr:response regulator [Candidatus Aminicenantes bacterium]
MRDALKIVKDVPISIALVDYRLNGEDGISTSKKLREEDKNIKVIILTGFPSYEIAVESMKSGVFDYISKGTSNKKIIQIIHKALQERRKEMIASGELDEDENCIKLILICSHAHIKDRLESIANANPDLKLLKTFPSVKELKRNKLAQKIDIALICPDSISGKETDTAEFISELPGLIPSVKPVIINESLTDDEKVHLIKQGAKGFCAVNSDTENIEKAMHLIKKGQIWASRQLTSMSLQALINERPALLPQKIADDEKFGLTDREKEILRAIVMGLKNKEIAKTLTISEPTVKTHINRIYKKVGVTSRSKAILKALESKTLE